MAWLLTLVAPAGTPVNIEIPAEHTPEQVENVLLSAPDGQWAVIYGVVDGKIAKVHVRPDRYGAFFLHEVNEPTPSP